MRKTQVALAALALMASTAALADGVTISGQMDVGVFNTGTDNNGAGGTFIEQGGMLDHSSITFNVSEDLGGGMKAFATLEAGFNANGYFDNGNGPVQGGAQRVFNRQSLIGLSGDFGTIGLGKQLSPFILTAALTNGGFGSFWVPRLMVGNGSLAGGAFAAGGTGLNGSGFFISNSVMYTSPSVSGWSLQAMTTTKSGTYDNKLNFATAAAGAAAGNDADKYTSFSLSGNLGPAFLAAAWQDRGGGTGVGYKSYTVGGTMPLLGDLSGFGSYMSDKQDGSDALASYALGVKYALNAATAVQIGYSANDATGNSEMTLTNLALTHSLSKRTSLYATAGRGKNVGSAIGNWKNDYSGLTNNTYGVGVAHSF